MIKKIIKSGLLVSLVFGLVGCTGDTTNEVAPQKVAVVIPSHGEIDDRIKILADNLLSSSRLTPKEFENIAVTSFVDLHHLNKTTSFGRFLSEGLFNELFVRGFNLVDFRAQESLSINATGEFFITRDIKKINKSVNNKYILVGTYSYMHGKVLLNARIIDNKSGKIVATAKTHYMTRDCKLIGDCPKPKAPRTITITTDNCSVVRCPTNYCEGSLCRK